MSMFYREEETYGPYRFDGVPDIFGPYGDTEFVDTEQGYSKKPVRSSKYMPNSHHPDCEYDGVHLDTCLCFELYNKDYEDDQEKEATETWKYYNGIAD